MLVGHAELILLPDQYTLLVIRSITEDNVSDAITYLSILEYIVRNAIMYNHIELQTIARHTLNYKISGCLQTMVRHVNG